MKGLGNTHPDPAGEKTLPNGAKGKNIDLTTRNSIFDFENNDHFSTKHVSLLWFALKLIDI